MSRTITLDQVRVASPCSQPWEDMCGDAKVRFCDRCELRVFNLSEMTRDEAQSVLDAHPDRLCVCFRPTATGAPQTLDYQPQKVGRSMKWWYALGAAGAIAATAIEAIFFFGRPKPSPMPLIRGGISIQGKVAVPTMINPPPK